MNLPIRGYKRPLELINSMLRHEAGAGMTSPWQENYECDPPSVPHGSFGSAPAQSSRFREGIL